MPSAMPPAGRKHWRRADYMNQLLLGVEVGVRRIRIPRGLCLVPDRRRRRRARTPPIVSYAIVGTDSRRQTAALGTTSEANKYITQVE